MEKDKQDFVIVGPSCVSQLPYRRGSHWLYHIRQLPLKSVVLFTLVLAGCLGAELLMNHDPAQFYLNHLNQAPDAEFYFGTDSLGRDLFSSIWYGGRISLFIGFLGTAILSVIGILYGCLSGMASKRIDSLLMRFAEMMSSIPSLLLLLLLLAVTGKPTPVSMAVIIGATSWMNLARIVRSEVRQLQTCGYVLAARAMGASFPHILLRHLLPNFFAAIMFIMVSSIGTCIRTESTLSFLGVGLPVEILSWGSMLSLANKALLTNTWWVIVCPGVFLILTLLCITNIGEYLHQNINKKESNL